MPERLHSFEHKISCFGGALNPGEDLLIGLKRECQEEIPGFLTEAEINSAVMIFENDEATIFAIETDLSGHRKTRATDRIGNLARVCLEGDGIVRSFTFVKQASDDAFAFPELAKVLRILAETGVEAGYPR